MNLSSITSSLPSQSQPGNSLDTANKQLKPDSAAKNPANTTQDNHQTALQIVNKTLTRAYEKISSHNSAATDYTNFEPLTAEKVAGNILGFIERRLQMDAADGATKEQLQSRLEAGLAGFKKGFADAADQIKALSLMSSEVETDIGKTKDLVLKGIDQLRAKFISEDADTTKAAAPATIKTLTEKPTTKVALPDFLPANTQVDSSRYEYGRASDFSFQLKTREGDTVTIHASSSEGFSYSNEKGTKTAQGSYSANQSMSWDVDGELNDAEAGAINDLLDKVDKLATQFFDGDLDTAFEQAKNLGYDDSQITSFSLNLAQTEVQQVTQTYKTFEPADESNSTPLLSEQLLPLGNFIRDLLNSINSLSLFPEPVNALSDAAKNITGEEDINKQQGLRLQEFIGKISSLLNDQSPSISQS